MSTTTDTGGRRFYHRPDGGLGRLVPNNWQRGHTWFSVIFLVATFGPMFHWFATSTRLVLGIPITMAWILGWMVLQTINMIGLYLTTIRRTAERIGREVEQENEAHNADVRAALVGNGRPADSDDSELGAATRATTGEGR